MLPTLILVGTGPSSPHLLSIFWYVCRRFISLFYACISSRREDEKLSEPDVSDVPFSSVFSHESSGSENIYNWVNDKLDSSDTFCAIPDRLGLYFS